MNLVVTPDRFPKTACQGCYFIFVQIWRCSLATSIVLVVIGAYLTQIINVNWAKDIFQRKLWRVALSSTEDGSMSDSPHGSASMPSPVLPAEKSHLEASCTRGNEASSFSISLTRGEDPFEGAITRLAVAVELGTEPLIYVRRKDVAEVVDALVENARTPGELSIASKKALARLAIFRRSKGKRQEKQRSVDSPEDRTTRRGKCAPSTERIRSNSMPLGSGEDHLSTSSSSAYRGKSLKDHTQFGEINAAPGRKTKASSGLTDHPSSSTTKAEKLLDLLRTTDISEGDDQGEEQPMCQQAFQSTVTPAPSSKVPAAWATIRTSPSRSGVSKAKMDSPPSTDSNKISRVPVSTHATSGKEAAFEDIWSTGWG